MPTPRHLSALVRAAQDAPTRESSEVAIGGRVAEPGGWVAGTIESSRGDLANRYGVNMSGGTAVTASSVLDGTPHEVGDSVWLVMANGHALIVGLR